MVELLIQADEVIYLENRFKEALHQGENTDSYLQLLGRAYQKLNEIKEAVFGDQILGKIYEFRNY